MDLKEDELRKIDRKNSLDENFLRQRNKEDSILSTPNTSHLPLNDINNTNYQGQLKSIEKAQKKWIENAKLWPVKDEMQNAQLHWLREFSHGTICTSTPQVKKKDPNMSFPWTPPRSSAEVSHRRGVCVYVPPPVVPPARIKVAQIEEPVNVSPSKKAPEDIFPKKSPGKFSPFPDADTRRERKTPKKRYITVRKKLERLKNVEKEQENFNEEKKDSVPDPKSEEKREAARQYILRKRAERERELEIQRRKEVKAEAEKKARMEKLRETQQRIIRNAMKRQTPEKSARETLESEEGGVSLSPFKKYAKYTKPKGKPQIYYQLYYETPEKRARDTPESEEDGVPVTRFSPRNILLQPGTSGLNKSVTSPPTRAVFVGSDVSLQKDGVSGALDGHNISGVLVDHGSPVYERFFIVEDRTPPVQDHFTDVLSKEYLPIFDGSPTKTTKPATPNTTPKSAASSASRLTNLSEDYENQYYAANLRSSSLASTSKESINVLQYIRNNTPQRNFPVGMPPSVRGPERSYNLMTAITNKHAAYELYNRECPRSDCVVSPEKPAACRSFLRNDFQKLQTPDKMKKVDEKGIQVCVEEKLLDPLYSCSNEKLDSSLGSIGIRSTQSEALEKPNVILRPTRVSEPPLSSHSKPFEVNVAEKPLQFGDEGFLDNLIETDIDPPEEYDNATSFYNDETNDHEQTLQEAVESNATKDRLPRTAKSVDPRECLCALDNLNLSAIRPEPVLGLNDGKFKDPNIFLKDLAASVHSAHQSTNVPDVFTKLSEKRKKPKSSLREVLNNAFVEASYSERDQRIEEEIKKLESFNISITNVMEKNKSFISDENANVKTRLEGGTPTALPQTSSAANNEVLPDVPRENILTNSSCSSSYIDIQSEDLSGTSIAKFSLNMFRQLLKDEDARIAHHSSLFKMKENALTEKTKAEIAFLEVEKKKLKEAGNEEGLRNIRKKIRGLIIKLEHDLEELQRFKKIARVEYRKRRQGLVEKINAIKSTMKMPDQKGTPSKEGKPATPTSETKKSHALERRGSDNRVLLLEKKRKELEERENIIAERLAELENISTWKQRLEEGEKRIQELEARLKMSPVQTKEREGLPLVERGTSPLKIPPSEDSPYDRIKTEGSYSDTFDQASSSSTHDRLEEKDARKLVAIKVPLSPIVTLKRRHSSGSDESLIQSQTETQSEASDMEVRVLALQQQLKQRKAKLESLHREFKKSQKERLIAKEKSLLSQIQAYDMYIEQVKKELDKERDSADVKIVRPLIKQPKIFSDRRKSDTWLIQERKRKEDGGKDPLLLGSGDFASKAVEEKRELKASAQKESLSPLETSTIEKLSLQSKMWLKTCSDPNIPRSLDDRTAQSRISHSSTESCESDIDKVKNQLELIGNHSTPRHELDKFSLSSSDVSPVDQSASFDKTSPEKKGDKISDATLISAEDRDHEESEENTLTQASIISKIVDSPHVEPDIEEKSDSSTIHVRPLELDRTSKSVVSEIETVSLLSINNSESLSEVSIKTGNTSESNEEIISDNVPVLEAMSDNVSERESKLIIVNENISDISNEKLSLVHTQSEFVTVISSQKIEAEVVSAKGSESKSPSEETVEEETKSYTESDIKKEAKTSNSESSSVKLDNSSSHDKVPSSRRKLFQDKAVSEDLTDGDKSSLQGSSESSLILPGFHKESKPIAQKEDSEVKEDELEESIKEVTYLEVSDHVYQEESEKDVSEDTNSDASLRTISRTSGSAPTVSKSLAEELQEVLEEEDSLKREENSTSDTQEQEKSTFHSESEVDEIVSKDVSDDFSNGSFPLPVISELKKKSIDLTESEKEISEVVSPEAEIDAEESFEKIVNISVQNKTKEFPEKNITAVSEVSEHANESVSISVPKSEFSSSPTPEESVNLIDLENSLNDKKFASVSQEVPEISSAKDIPTSNAIEVAVEENKSSTESEKSATESDKSVSESEKQAESEVKSPEEEVNFEDSLDESSPPLSSLDLKSKLYGKQEEGYESISEEGSDSYLEEKLSEEDVYAGLSGDPDRTDSKSPGVPLIDALQREGASSLDIVWRSIAEGVIEEGTELVISTYLKKIHEDFSKKNQSQVEKQKVGDNGDETLEKEKLPADKAAEAEVLRLQQMRIDKEIEELEEEEARRYYYRPIPDKPPPPYTPRRSSLVSSVVEAAGELWAGSTKAPDSFMPGSHLREFIWDLASELVQQANPPPPPTLPPWQAARRSRPRRPIRTKEELLAEIEKEAKIYLGVEERQVRENLIIRWSRKRRDHVDEILVRESGEEEWEWTNFSEEENIIKNRIADSLIDEAIANATAALAAAFTAKFK